MGDSRSRWSGEERRSVLDDDISRLPVELSRLHEIASKITTRQEVSDILENLARLAAEEAGSDRSAIFLLDDDGLGLRLKAHMGLPDAFVDRLLNTRLGYGVWGLASMKSRVVIAERLENDYVTAVDRDLYRRAGIKSAWAVPLVGRDDHVMGAFAVFYAGFKRPSRRDVFMAQLYGFHASMAIENARRHEQLRAQAVRYGKTSLFNHDHFLSLFRLEIERAARQESELSLLMADIDDYKRYNDTYGHLMGGPGAADNRRLSAAGGARHRHARPLWR